MSKNESHLLPKKAEKNYALIVSNGVLYHIRDELLPFALYESDTRNLLFVCRANKAEFYSYTFIVQQTYWFRDKEPICNKSEIKSIRKVGCIIIEIIKINLHDLSHIVRFAEIRTQFLFSSRLESQTILWLPVRVILLLFTNLVIKSTCTI